MRVVSIIVTVFVVIGLALPAGAKKRLKLQISKDDVDLVNRTLYFKLNKPADSAQIKIYTPDGELLTEKVELYNGAQAGKKLSIGWSSLLGNEDNFRLDLKVTDVDGFWVSWEIIRFYLEIPHEDVVFETGKWTIRPSEAHKLDSALKLLVGALKKYGRLVQCHLYVGGFTDTVGSISANRELSRNRAKSIARYFRSHGVKRIPIFVRGFGEESLKVKTGDSVDEERNRRAIYIISTFPPEMAGPGSWQSL